MKADMLVAAIEIASAEDVSAEEADTNLAWKRLNDWREYVVFNQSGSFAMTAFKNLPECDDFVKGMESDMLRMRTLAKCSHMKSEA